MKQISKTVIAKAKWLRLCEIEYQSHDEKIRKWETVERVNTGGAVCIFATIKQTGELVLIRQTRPPVNGFVIEIPAGLIDPGEDPKVTAVRELREETGYIGKITWFSPKAYSSPGLSNEFLYLAKMEIDLDEQKELKTDFDDSEYIETFLVKPENLMATLEQKVQEGDSIDIKVLTYAMTILSNPSTTK